MGLSSPCATLESGEILHDKGDAEIPDYLPVPDTQTAWGICYVRGQHSAEQGAGRTFFFHYVQHSATSQVHYGWAFPSPHSSLNDEICSGDMICYDLICHGLICYGNNKTVADRNSRGAVGQLQALGGSPGLEEQGIP